MSTHEQIRDLLGAHVLGGLDETDRAVVLAHLPTCAACRDEVASFAPLPALLRRRPEATAGAAPPVVPLEAVLARVRQERSAARGRRRVRLLVAAAVVLLALGTGVVGLTRGGTPASGPAATLQALAGSDVSGQTELTTKPWGTSVSLQVTGLPSVGPFTMVVLDTTGASEQAATWSATPGASADVVGASSYPTSEVRSVQVRDRDGRILASSTTAG